LGDKSISTPKLDRLFAHIPKPRIGEYGIADKDVQHIVVAPQLVIDIRECLESGDDLEIGFALFYLENLSARPDFREVAGQTLNSFLTHIRKLLCHESYQIRSEATRTFVAFRSDIADYSKTMFELLHSSDPAVNLVALWAAPTFLSIADLGQLLPFQEDSDFGETGGMGGPKRFHNRDLALETAENIAGVSFSNGDCFEMRDGVQVSWKSWSVFNNWLEGKKKRKWF